MQSSARRFSVYSAYSLVAMLGMVLAAMAPERGIAQNVSLAYSQTILPVSGFGTLAGIAEDASGNLFVADIDNDKVVEILSSCINGTPRAASLDSNFSGNCTQTLWTGSSGGEAGPCPLQVTRDLVGDLALDASGNLFFTNDGRGTVGEVPRSGSGYGSPVTIASGLCLPHGLLVDGSGNILVADSGNSRVAEIPWTGSGYGDPTTYFSAGLSAPTGLALDGAGDLFISDATNGTSFNTGRVLELPSGSTSLVEIIGGLFQPLSISVDGQGNIFITNFGASGAAVVQEIPYLGSSAYGQPINLGTGMNAPNNVAVDSKGNLLVTDFTSTIVTSNEGIIQGRIWDLQRDGVNFGSVNVCPAGQNPAPCSETLTLNYSVTGGPTLGTPPMLTGGAPNLDFAPASGSTCIGSVSSTCTVKVTFTPTVAGARSGAVQIVDSNGNVLSTALIYGFGLGPQIAFGIEAQSSVLTRGGVDAVAVDGAGNVYAASGANVVKQTPALNGTQSTLSINVGNAGGIAVDGAGDVYVSDLSNGDVVELPASGGAQVTVASGLSQPRGLAVDGAGDLFIANSGGGNVIEVPAQGGPQIMIGTGWQQPYGVAVDANGDLLVADASLAEVVKISSTGAQSTAATGFVSPTGVAVDAAGDLWVADEGSAELLEVPAGGGAPIPMGTGWNQPTAVALDGTGDIYVGDLNTGVTLLQQSQTPTLTFAPTPVGGTSSDSPKSLPVENIGNTTLDVLTTFASYIGLLGDGNFTQDIIEPTTLDCSGAGFGLSPGQACQWVFSFTPQVTGPIVRTMASSYEAVGGDPIVETITLSGSGFRSQTISFTGLPSTATYGSAGSYTLNATASSGLPVSYLVSGPASFQYPNTLFITGAGTVMVTAIQPGDGNYNAAAPVSQTIIVGQSGQTITFTGLPATATYASAGPYTLIATASSGLMVSYSVTGPASISGDTLTITGAGTVVVTASQSGNTNYAAATQVSQTIIVAAAPAPTQVAFTGTAPVTLGSGFSRPPSGVAVDAAGDVFVADRQSGVYEMVAVNGNIPANPTIRTLGSGFAVPQGVAVDGAGDVFVADPGIFVNTGAVYEMVAVGGSIPANPTIRTLGSGFSAPAAVAVDAAGDVFVADDGTGAVYEMVALGGSIPATNPAILTLSSGLNHPAGVAVDGAGDVFVADRESSAVYEMVALGGSIPANPTIRTLGSGFSAPAAVAVDAAGDVFVADVGTGAVYEMVAVGGSIPTTPAILTLSSGFTTPVGVAVNAAGNIFVADAGFIGDRPPVNIPPEVYEFQAGSVNFGSANVCAAGQTSPAPCSQTLTLNYNVAANTTIGGVKVLTTGAANLDFRAEASDTSTTLCTAQTYDSQTTCTVDVTFAPLAPGQRKGAVEILDNSGNVLVTTPIYGMGTAPAIAFSPSNTITLASGSITAGGIAVDTAGDVFLTDSGTVYEMVAVSGTIPANPTILTLDGGFSNPGGVAVDGAGDVFVADLGSGVAGKSNGAGAVYEMVAVNGSISATNPAILTLGSGFATPAGVAVDAAGDIFVTDLFGNAVKEIVAVNGSIPADPNILTLGSGFNGPFGVAVDAAGDVFVTDYGNDAVKEMVAVNGSIPANPTILTLGSGFSGPFGVAVDAAGDVFVADSGNNAVKEMVAVNGSIPATNPIILTLGSGFSGPFGVAVDAAGNVFVADSGNSAVKEITRSVPPSLSFASTAVGSTSSDSPQPVQLQNIGNAALTLSGVLSDPTDFAQVAGSGTPEDCILASTSLNPGAQCNLSLNSSPQSAGPISATVTLADNALNGNLASQTIQLSGTGTQTSQTISFTGLPGTAIYGPGISYTLNATASSGLPVSYSVTGPASVSGNTLTITSVGTVMVTASQAGNGNYNPAAPVSQTIIVSQGSQTMTFTGLPMTATYPAGPYTLNGTASSGLAVSYSVTGPASISGSILTITGPGTVVVTAKQAGNTDYAAAPPVAQTIIVSQSSQTITFTGLPATATYPAGPYTLNGTASSGLAVSYSVTGPASVSGNTLTIAGAGRVVVTASQAGNANYAAAIPVAQTISVNPSLAPPKLSKITPSSGSGSGGTKVTITGSNLLGVTEVTFGNKRATDVKIISATEITAITPEGSGEVTVSATGPGGTCHGLHFTYLAPPKLSKITPSRGPESGGTKVTITGSNFLGVTEVTFGNKRATDVKIISATEITAITPEGSGEVTVSATGPGGTCHGLHFTYLAPPKLSKITPSRGSESGGTKVTITGSNFLGVTEVTFGNKRATDVKIISATEITAITPEGSGEVTVSATGPGGTCHGLQYTYLKP